MPLWQMFVPEGAYTSEEKKTLANGITDIYSNNFDIPRFYTTVFFHENKPESFLIGGEPRSQFVQVAIVHAARTHDQVAESLGITSAQFDDLFLDHAHSTLKPFVQDRDYELELHVEEARRELWNIDGMPPPPPWSDTEKLWAKENKSSPYDLANP